jgi:hypothetical protein
MILKGLLRYRFEVVVTLLTSKHAHGLHQIHLSIYLSISYVDATGASQAFTGFFYMQFHVHAIQCNSMTVGERSYSTIN